MERNLKAYILRPPYLYGPVNNVYREAFVFDCALENRKFYLPREGSMKLQFFHVEDLCRFIDILVERHPKQHIFCKLCFFRKWCRRIFRIYGT